MEEKNNQRVSVFIDGSNLYFKLRSFDVSNLSRFNYRGLIRWLVRERQIAYAGYYVGVVRARENDEKGQRMRLAQRNFFNFLQSPQQGFALRKGYLMHSDDSYHEKGVDVQLAVDLLVGAYENSYDTAIVISSDTDLIPAMHKVKELRKQVEYIGFSHEPSLAMQTHATLSRLLIKEEVQPFVFQQLL